MMVCRLLLVGICRWEPPACSVRLWIVHYWVQYRQPSIIDKYSSTKYSRRNYREYSGPLLK